jgi:hypothetical protein
VKKTSQPKVPANVGGGGNIWGGGGGGCDHPGDNVDSTMNNKKKFVCSKTFSH